MTTTPLINRDRPTPALCPALISNIESLFSKKITVRNGSKLAKETNVAVERPARKP